MIVVFLLRTRAEFVELVKASPRPLMLEILPSAEPAKAQGGRQGSQATPSSAPRQASAGPVIQPEAPPAAATPAYATQLRELGDMGFHDPAACVAALDKAKGDVNLAVSYLLQ